MDTLSAYFTQKLDKETEEAVLQKVTEQIESLRKNSLSYPPDMKEIFEHILKNYTQYILTETKEICHSDNPRFSLRKKIVHSAYSLAHLSIFLKDDLGLQIPYTTTEMKQYMNLLFRTEQNLIHFTKIISVDYHKMNDEELEYIVNYSFLRASFILGCYNTIRLAFHDFNQDLSKDWYIAMCFSMHIAVEHGYRKSLNLTSNIQGDDASTEQIFHFLWFKMFEMLDMDDPKEFWEKQWLEHLHKSAPF